jgi:hypothetical protein
MATILMYVLAAGIAIYALVAATAYAVSRKPRIFGALAAGAGVWAVIYLATLYPHVLGWLMKWLLLFGAVVGLMAFMVRAFTRWHDEADERVMAEQWEDWGEPGAYGRTQAGARNWAAEVEEWDVEQQKPE